MPAAFAMLRGKRSGFTLLELLVVLTILAVLAALVLPVIQMVREASRKVECANHLKQIAIAFHIHHEQHGFFPAGGRSWADPPTYDNRGLPYVGAQQRAGWGFQIIPYLQSNNAWRGSRNATIQQRTLQAIGTPNPYYFCPSRREPMRISYTPPRATSDPLAMAIYQLQPGSRPPIFTAPCDYLASNYNEQQDGVVRQVNPNQMQDIVDGTSQTLLIGEKRMNLFTIGSQVSNDDQGYAAGFDKDTMGQTDISPGLDLDEHGIPSILVNRAPFGSSHPGRFNAVFADGSLHSISYNIDLSVLKQIGSIRDGKSFTVDEF